MLKKILLFLVVCAPTFSFAQTPENSRELSLKDYKTYGYSSGVRLDSLDVQLATFSSYKNSRIRHYSFDAGAVINRSNLQRQLMLTDKDGNELTFNSGATLLNFLDFNGWKIKDIPSAGNGYYGDVILQRK
jgi:hypothetical protein